MARLSVTVIVRHPSTGQIEVLSEGSDLPEWADGLVGDHALDGGDGPSAAWKVSDLREYAQENEIDLGGATTKAEILAAIRG